jgi:hypothetical protein
MRTTLALLLTAALTAPLQAQDTHTGPASPPAPDAAAARGDEGPSLTVYSTADPAGFDPQQFVAQQRMGFDPNFASQVPGFGVIKELRQVDLKAGRNTLSFVDVAQFIDPTTVSFADLTAPETAVLEQQFLFDLVSPSKLLEKYVDQDVTLHVPLGDGKLDKVTGKLLSANQGQLVVQTGDGLRIFQQGSVQPELGKLPGGLITKPTLQWLVTAKQAGQHKVRTTYQTSGITWRSDYNLVLNAEDTQADLGAWVTLLNLSGASYPNAQLKLIAGDVQRIQPPQMQPMRMRRNGGMAPREEADVAGFEEKSFFEYHLYTLPRRTDVAQNTTQQIALFPTVQGIKVERVLVYYGLPYAAQWGFTPTPHFDRNLGNQSNKKIDVYIRFQNKEDNKLGIPLPAGKIRVYKLDAPANAKPGEGTLEFVGEDIIDHTARNQEVLAKIGQAFDVTGERTQTDFTLDERGHVMTETIKIVLSNGKKDKPAKVIVKENLYRWVKWEITQESDEHKKIDARTIHYEVEVPADGKKEVTYTVKYTW